MDTKQQIEGILYRYRANQLSTEKAIESILLLFNVSGNEANQPDNKKDGEVAVAFEKWMKKNKNKLDFSRTRKSLFSEFTKATDR